VGASHKKREAILREPGGTFAPQLSASGGRLTRRFDLRYFKSAKHALSPEKFGQLVKELHRLATGADKDCDRIQASQVLLRTFLPKDWHAQWALALEDEESGLPTDTRPIPKLLDAVEAIVIKARAKRGGASSSRSA
jgi:hypothetical protein